MDKRALAYVVSALLLAMSPLSLIAAERDQSGEALGRALKSKAAESGSPDALRAVNKNNPCAELGAGFVRVEGSSTCVRAGGNVRIDVGAQH